MRRRLIAACLVPALLGAGVAAGQATTRGSSPVPVGKYKFVVTASDGVAAPVTFHHSLKVLAPDTNVLKNTAPIASKITPVQALAGYPISFPILAIDRDGDALTISADTTKAPFTAGASFDALTHTFAWTPGAGDIGKVVAHFTVSDGLNTVKRAGTIKVVSPSIF